MASKYWLGNHPSGRIIGGSGTHDLGAIADEAEEAFDITVTGAALGDMVLGISCSLDSIDLQITGQVTAANTVTVVVSNLTTGSLNLGSAKWSVLVLPGAAVSDIISEM